MKFDDYLSVSWFKILFGTDDELLFIRPDETGVEEIFRQGFEERNKVYQKKRIERQYCYNEAQFMADEKDQDDNLDQYGDFMYFFKGSNDKYEQCIFLQCQKDEYLIVLDKIKSRMSQLDHMDCCLLMRTGILPYLQKKDDVIEKMKSLMEEDQEFCVKMMKVLLVVLNEKSIEVDFEGNDLEILKGFLKRLKERLQTRIDREGDSEEKIAEEIDQIEFFEDSCKCLT